MPAPVELMYQLDPFLRQNKAVMSFPWHGFRLLKLKNAQVLPKLSQLHPIRLDWHHSCFVRLALKILNLEPETGDLAA